MIDSMYDEKAIQHISDKVREAAEILLNLQNEFGVDFTLTAHLTQGQGKEREIVVDTFYLNSNIALNSLVIAKEYLSNTIAEMNELCDLISRGRLIVICVNDQYQESETDKVNRSQYYTVEAIHRNPETCRHYYTLKNKKNINPLGYNSKMFQLILDQAVLS